MTDSLSMTPAAQPDVAVYEAWLVAPADTLEQLIGVSGSQPCG